MSTWATVILKYITAGMSFGLTTTEKVVAGKVIPALSWQWAITFDPSAALGLLTIVFGLYFGNKFSPSSKDSGQENPAITK